MGGEGSMSSANVSLKNNRALAKRRNKFKSAKNLMISKSGKTKLEFIQVSSTELEQIKNQIRIDARKKNIKNIFALVLTIIVIMMIVYLTIS